MAVVYTSTGLLNVIAIVLLWKAVVSNEKCILIFFLALRNGRYLRPPTPHKFRNAWSRKQGIPTRPLTVTYLLDAPLAI